MFSRPLFTLCALLLAAPAFAATTITIRPDGSGTSNGDAFVTTGPSNNLTVSNYGGAGALAVSASLANGSFASVLRFDIASAKATFDATYGAGNWWIESAVLELATSNPNNAIFNSPNVAGAFSVQWFATDGWTEGTGTPAAASGTGVKWSDLATLLTGAESEGTFTIASIADGAIAQYTLSPSSGLLADLLAGGPTSFALQAADSTMTAVFNARSFGTASRRPALILTAAPEPGRIVSLGLGMVAFCLRRRRTSSPA